MRPVGIGPWGYSVHARHESTETFLNIERVSKMVWRKKRAEPSRSMSLLSFLRKAQNDRLNSPLTGARSYALVHHIER